jgi:phosphatidate cytidylyltransferase
MIENTFDSPIRAGIVFGLLLLVGATLLTFFLRSRNRENEAYPKVLKIIGGWWIISAILIITILIGGHGLTLLFLLLSLLGLREFLAARNSEFINTPVIVALSLLTVAHYSFIILNWKTFFLFIVPVMSFIYLPFLFLLRRRVTDLLSSLWAAQSGLMLCVYFLSFVPGIIFLNDNPTALRKIDPVSAFLFLFLVTELNDVFQFVCGKIFGKHRLVPELSPNKTLEGFVGGLIFTTALAFLLGPYFLQLNFWQAGLAGIAISLSGMSGDLMFSAVKRTYGVKDFSDLIPGHGGALDRVDSLVFTAPTLYCLLYLFIH